MLSQPVASASASPEHIRSLELEVDALRHRVAQLECALADARALTFAVEATQLGRTLLVYVLDVLCAMVRPQRGYTIVADVTGGPSRTVIKESQGGVGPLQLVLERPGLSHAIAGRATKLTTRYESVLWLPIVHAAEATVILCLRRSPSLPFTDREQEIGEVLGPLVISAVQTGRRQFDLHEDEDALRTLGSALSTCIRTAGGRVAAMEQDAERVAGRIGLSYEQTSTLKMATILHDIGSVDMAEETLNKDTGLTIREAEQLREHAAFGAEIVRQISGMDAVIPLVLHHHERWDGSGYPTGLKGEEIPLGSRIIAVLDAYYAMITPRTFRPAFPIEHVVQELQRMAGSRYDPAIVEEFVAMVHRGR
jgi:hypothetical protein